MGRCYEFGVSVHDGCEQAMVVAPEGGSCVCPSCGASCPGRFDGCAGIVAQPGFVPLAAPAWARPSSGAGNQAPPVATARGAAVSPLAELHGDLTAVRALLEALAQRPDRASEAMQAIEQALEARDRELADAFSLLTKAYTDLTAEVAADRRARQDVAAALDRIAERLAALELASGPRLGLGRSAG